MGLGISNLVQASRQNTVSNDNLYQKNVIIEETNKELRVEINEIETICNTLKNQLEMSECAIKTRRGELITLDKENKLNINKYVLAQNHYDDLKKEFDILNVNNSDDGDTIKELNESLEKKENKIKVLEDQISCMKGGDNKLDLEIVKLKEKNQELRKKSITSQQELTKLKQNLSMINNIVDKVMD